MGTPAREQAINNQLNKTLAEYLEAKTKFEVARIEFEAAREKFGGVRTLAADVMNPLDWWHWQQKHKGVRFVAMPIGDAILELLRTHATERAWAVTMGDAEEYEPDMSLTQIAEGLEAGGFEFKSTAARREVNGALLQLKGVVKGDFGNYKIETADEILDNATQSTNSGDEEAEQQEEK